ncbi:MAG: hypothetical protein ACQEWV_12680 [Bacillota bacterium]
MKYLCLKDWKLNGTIYFMKNKSYKGRVVKSEKTGVNCVKMVGENNLRIKFETGNEYFTIA